MGFRAGGSSGSRADGFRDSCGPSLSCVVEGSVLSAFVCELCHLQLLTERIRSAALWVALTFEFNVLQRDRTLLSMMSRRIALLLLKSGALNISFSLFFVTFAEVLNFFTGF